MASSLVSGLGAYCRLAVRTSCSGALDENALAVTLSSATGRILHWWDYAWLGSLHRERFLLEAAVSLPTLIEEPAPADIYQAMLHQRARLKADQQLAEWTFGG
jgi:hypothetical protein